MKNPHSLQKLKIGIERELMTNSNVYQEISSGSVRAALKAL
jgi:hypothetical protein